MSLYGNQSYFRPIRYTTIHIPDAVVGEEIPGNETTSVGRQFLCVVANLLQEQCKLTSAEDESDFGRFMEGAEVVMGFTFPGLEFDLVSREFQHIGYIGSEDDRLSWSELESLDFNFDGIQDMGSIDEALLLDIYLTTGAFDSAVSMDALDYSGFWNERRESLSSTESFWQMISDNDYLSLDNFGERMMFLLGINEMKRRWAYGMSLIGVNPFEATLIDSSSFEGVGGVNLQIFFEYVYQRQAVVNRMREIMGDESSQFYRWARDTVRPQFESYLNSIDRTARDSAIDAFRGLLATPEETAAIVVALSNVSRELQRINDASGFATPRLQALMADFEGLRTALVNYVNLPEADPAEISRRLTEINELIVEIGGLQDDTSQMVNSFWNEFSMASSVEGINQPTDAEMDEEEFNTIRSNIRQQMKKTMNYIVGCMSTNMVFKQLNRNNDARVKQEKQEIANQEKSEEKAKARQAGEAKKQKKMAEMRALQRSQQIKEMNISNQNKRKVNTNAKQRVK